MSVLEDWRVEAQIRRQRVDLWWQRLGLLLICASTTAFAFTAAWVVRWLCGVRW